MVLTPLAEKQKFLRIPEEAPEVQPVPPDRVPPDQTVLTVLASGKVLLNREELEVPEAMARLHAAYDQRPSRPLFFNAQDEVSYDQAFQVLDAAHAAGVNTIGLMTDPPLTARAPTP
jgi:biopolymer transport protein TolR